MSQLVVIRFAQPRGNKNVLSIDQDAMQADLHAQLEVLLKARLGEETRLRLEQGATNDIRLEGRFSMKPLEVKAVVSEVLGEVMDGFDPSGYTR
jgi:CO dehydrogenase nickel-insertion accessory protein CooC1